MNNKENNRGDHDAKRKFSTMVESGNRIDHLSKEASLR